MQRRLASSSGCSGLLIMACALSACSSSSEPGMNAFGGSATSAGGEHASSGANGIGGENAGGAATYGAFTYRWSLLDPPSGNALGCDSVLIDQFELHLTKDFETSTAIDSCRDGAAVTILPAGTYDVSAVLATRDGVALAGESRGLKSVKAGETVALEPFRFAIHTFKFPWSVSKAGVASTCEAVGAGDVMIHWTGSFASLGIQHRCADLQSDYVIMGAGPYQLVGTLLSPSGSTLATWRMNDFMLPESGSANPPTIPFDVP